MKKTNKFIILLLFCSLFLGIGYASITDIDLTIQGEANLVKQTGLFITNVTKLSSNNADLSLSSINNNYQTMLNTTTILNDDSTSSVTYQVTIKNGTNLVREFSGIVYDNAFYDNSEITYELNGLSVGDTLAPGEERTFTLTYKYAEVKDHYNNNTLNAIINFEFGNETHEEDFHYYNCVFNGQNNDIVGECAGGEHIDHINTGIELFNTDNNGRDFEIGFTIGNIDPSRFVDGQVDTIFSALREESPYPGIAFRIQNKKWFFQAGNGVDTATKVSFSPDAVTSFKIIRKDNKIYYILNDGLPIFAADMSNLAAPFNEPLVLGTALNANGTVMPARFLVAELDEIYFHYGTEFEDLDSYMEDYIRNFIGVPLNDVFTSTDSHTFDGTADTVINTGVPLFSNTNYQKSFWVSLTIDSIALNDNVNQATLFNAKDEANIDVYPGVMIRKKSNTTLELNIKDGSGSNSSVILPNTTKTINIIKKGDDFFYQVDGEPIKALGEDNSFANFDPANCFDTPATFGSNIDKDGNYGRISKGIISNMFIKISD